MNWLLTALILSTSFSLRTPKVGDETDWQFLASMEKPMVYRFYLEEEQDAGKRYTNQEYFVRHNGEIDFWGKKYFIRERYVNIESRSIFYNQIETNYKRDDFYVGYALRHVDGIPSHRGVVGYEIDKYFWSGYRAMVSVNVTANNDNFDYSLYTKFSFSGLDLIRPSALVIFENANGSIYRQYKITIDVELPQEKES